MFDDVFRNFSETLYSEILSYLKYVLQTLFPYFISYFAIIFGFKFLISLLQPKYDGPIFDDTSFDNFDLMYESLIDNYENENDFINDYFSDFTSSSEDDVDIDEIVDLGFWNSLSDEYENPETLFINEYQDDFSISYNDFDGSLTDFFEYSE